MPLQDGNSSNTKNPIHGAAGSHVVRPPANRGCWSQRVAFAAGMGQCLGRRTDKDNRAGIAALAEGLVFQAQQRPLSSSSGPQRGGTQEVTGSLQSPVCGDPEGISGCGQHWAPGSSFLLAPHPTFPPSSFFFPALKGQRRQRHQRTGKGGGAAHEKAMAMGSYQSASTPSSKPNRAS